MKKIMSLATIFVLAMALSVWADDKENLLLEKKARIEAQFREHQAEIKALRYEFKEVSDAWIAKGGVISKDGQWTIPKAKKEDAKPVE